MQGGSHNLTPDTILKRFLWDLGKPWKTLLKIAGNNAATWNSYP